MVMTAAHAYELPSGGRLVLPARDDAEIVAGHAVPLSRNGQTIAALTPIDPDQAWFWTPEWQAGERQVDAELADPKRKARAMTGDEFLSWLDDVRDSSRREVA